MVGPVAGAALGALAYQLVRGEPAATARAPGEAEPPATDRDAPLAPARSSWRSPA